MRNLFLFLLLAQAAGAGAGTLLLKDGAKIEGEVTGEMDGALLVKTKYGSLTINKNDIQERQESPAAVLPAVPAALSTQPAVVGPSTSALVEVSTSLPEAAPVQAPKLTFLTLQPSTMTRQLVYLEAGVAVATETYDAAGALLSAEGAIADGTYTEYYQDGGLKTVKTMLGSKPNGTLKAFYPSGALQLEAYYLAGGREGPFKYYTGSGVLLMEASYKNDLLNGWKREYGNAGEVVSESYYTDDRLAEPPAPQAAAAKPEPAAPNPAALVTVKVISLARGERFTFRLNNKYIGRLHLDKEFNVITMEGKLPDGTVSVYTKDEKLAKEFVFLKNEVKALRVYEPGGPLTAEYTYAENKAVKK